MLNIGVVIGLIKKLAPVASPEAIAQAVNDYLDDHPEIEVADGSITEEKLAADVALILSTLESDVSDVKNAIHGLELDEKILRSELPGTSTVVVMDSNGNPTSITYTANNETVRTDTFVWGTDSVTETRTLANGKYIIITTNLNTLAQTISEVQEVA